MPVTRPSSLSAKAKKASATALLLSAGLSLTAVSATSCAAFDESGNAYLFGTPSGDIYLGAQTDFAAGTTTAIKNLTAVSGRPAFDGNNTQCFTVSLPLPVLWLLLLLPQNMLMFILDRRATTEIEPIHKRPLRTRRQSCKPYRRLHLQLCNPDLEHSGYFGWTGCWDLCCYPRP